MSSAKLLLAVVLLSAAVDINYGCVINPAANAQKALLSLATKRLSAINSSVRSATNRVNALSGRKECAQLAKKNALLSVAVISNDGEQCMAPIRSKILRGGFPYPPLSALNAFKVSTTKQMDACVNDVKFEINVEIQKVTYQVKTCTTIPTTTTTPAKTESTTGSSTDSTVSSTDSTVSSTDSTVSSTDSTVSSTDSTVSSTDSTVSSTDSTVSSTDSTVSSTDSTVSSTDSTVSSTDSTLSSTEGTTIEPPPFVYDNY